MKRFIFFFILTYSFGAGAQTLSKIIGITNFGGINKQGSLFEIQDTVFTKKHDFQSPNPGGQLVELSYTSNGLLFGYVGSAVNPLDGHTCWESIFRYNTVDSSYAIIHNFESDTNGIFINGRQPAGALLPCANGKFYGLTNQGGQFGYGIIFSFDTATNTFTRVHDFDSINGSYPQYKLRIHSNGLLYGTTTKGGTTDDGTLFSFDITNNTFTKVHDFSFAAARNPYSELFEDSLGRLVGTTRYGGNANSGILYSYDINNTTLTKLHDFSLANTPCPSGILCLNNKVYGTTEKSTGSQGGEIYSYDLTSSTYTSLYSFSSGTSYFRVTLKYCQALNLLVGSSYSGGVNNGGTVFSFDLNTNTYSTKYNLSPSSGYNSNTQLVQTTGNIFYGTTINGGIMTKYGSLFKYDFSSSVFKKEFNFNNVPGGGIPMGALIYYNGFMYGTAKEWGKYGWGCIFKYDPGTGIYSVAKDLDSTMGYCYSLALVNGKFYGYGSTKLFSFDPNSNVLTSYQFFNYRLGTWIPVNDSILVGTSDQNGTYNKGFLFTYNTNTNVYQNVYSFPTTSIGSNPCLLKHSNGKVYLPYNGLLSYNYGSNHIAYEITNAAGLPPKLIEGPNGDIIGACPSCGANSKGALVKADISNNKFAAQISYNTPTAIGENAGLVCASDGFIYSYGRSGMMSSGQITRFDLSNGVYKIIKQLIPYEGEDFVYTNAVNYLEKNPVLKIFTQPQNQNTCLADTLVLGVFATGQNINYAWKHNGIGVGTNQSTYLKPGVIYPDSGKYWCELSDFYGNLLTTDTVVVSTSNLYPTLSMQYNDTVFCKNAAVKLIVSGADTYLWYNNTTNDSLTFAANSSGWIFAWGKLNTGCQSKDSIYLTVNSISSPTVIATPAVTLCFGDSVKLTTSIPYKSYYWNIVDTLSYRWVKYTSTYSVTVTDSATGCSSTGSKFVSFNSLPSATILTLSDTIDCQHNPINLYLNNFYPTMLWNTGNTNNFINVTNPGKYYVSVIDWNGCKASDTLTLAEDTLCVWPGDSNEDLVADNADILPIGLKFGKLGIPRLVQGNLWQGNYCMDWNDTLSSGLDIKHVDCNGDSLIDFNDTLAVNLNYGLTHPARYASPQIIQSTNPDVSLTFSKNLYFPGDTVFADVHIGSIINQQSNFYGAAFSINYDATKVKPGTELFYFTNSWVGTINQNKIKISKIFPSGGKVDAGLTRITHTDTNGYGKIAVLSFILKDTLSGNQLYFTIVNGIKTNNTGQYSNLNAGTDSVALMQGVIGINDQQQKIDKNIVAFPNPANNEVTVASINSIKLLIIYNCLGEIVFRAAPHRESIKIDINHFPPGIYTIRTNEGVLKLFKN